MPPPAEDEPADPRGRGTDESFADWVARLREDMHVRAAAGSVPRVEEYLRKFPALVPDADAVLDLIATERLLRREAGEPAYTTEFVLRFPDHGAEIERQFALDLDLDEFHAAEEAAMPQDRVPPCLPDRYQYVRLIDEGGFGVVWLYRDLGLGPRPVAIKTLHPGRNGQEMSARFLREANMAARVRHPNVCVIHDLNLDHEPAYLVLEYVPGDTLRDILKLRGRLDVKEAVRIAQQIAAGSHACHTQGIVHRDLKPGNIKVDDEGRVKILDFGLARPFDTDRDQFTKKGQVLGTMAYLSPEQTYGGHLPIEDASDQFALGVILYEMLTDKRPFAVPDDPDGTATTLRIRLCQPPPTPPNTLRPEIDSALESYILRMLQRGPSDRFGSMKEVEKVLQAYLNGDRTVVPPRPPRRWSRVAAVAAVGAAITAAWGLLSILTTPLTVATPPTLRIPPIVRKKPPPPQLVSTADMLELIRADLDRDVKAADQPFQQYFTLTHLATDPGVGPGEYQRYGDILTQLLPLFGLSTPHPINPERTVFRADFRAVGPGAGEFRKVLHRHNPYARKFDPYWTEDRLSAVSDDLGGGSGWWPTASRPTPGRTGSWTRSPT